MKRKFWRKDGETEENMSATAQKNTKRIAEQKQNNLEYNLAQPGRWKARLKGAAWCRTGRAFCGGVGIEGRKRGMLGMR